MGNATILLAEETGIHSKEELFQALEKDNLTLAWLTPEEEFEHTSGGIMLWEGGDGKVFLTQGSTHSPSDPVRHGGWERMEHPLFIALLLNMPESILQDGILDPNQWAISVRTHCCGG